MHSQPIMKKWLIRPASRSPVAGPVQPMEGKRMSARIHPTAIVAPQAELGENVEVGAFAVIEGKVRVGADCVIRPGAYLFGGLTMGQGNLVCTGAVLGEQPQHTKYKGEETTVEIGDHNVIREHVTIHRGTSATGKTVVGNHNFLMVHSHIAHDCVIGDHCILANGSMLGGHCHLENNVFISGNSALHQFVHVGRLALLSGVSGATKDIPPFIIQQNINNVSGVNVIGMRRAGISREQIDAVRHAFHLIFRSGLSTPVGLAEIEHNLGDQPLAREFADFIRRSQRGISHMRSRFHSEAA